MVVKGHNRDTAWFSVTDSEWPALHRAFDAVGRQRASLSSFEE
jgi:hypothetical protein